MFKIVRGATFAALQEQAAQAESLRQQLAAAQQDAQAARADADAARADATKARTDLEGVVEDKRIGLAALRDAANDPARRPSVRGLIAVSILRDLLQSATAEAARTGGELDPSLRFVQTIIGDETDDGTLPATGNTVPDHNHVPGQGHERLATSAPGLQQED